MKFSALLLFVASASVGCGRSNRVYPDRTSTGTQDGTITVDGRDLPKSFADQSVNQGSAALTSGKEIELKVLAGAGFEGSFNSSGTGNFAALGLTTYDQTRLSDLSTFNFETRRSLGDLNPSVVLLVDLECGTTANVSAVFAEDLVANADDFNRVDVSTSAAIWSVKGAELKDTQDATLLSTNSKSSLSALLSAYPNACLRNASSSESILPKSPLAGIAITLGSPSTITQNHLLIRRIEVGTKVFDSANWGT